jgi:hypothetical protein
VIEDVGQVAVEREGKIHRWITYRIAAKAMARR